MPLNSTMIAVALPAIATDFDLSIGRTSLLVTVYLVAMLVGQPMAGRISDRIGQARAIRGALALFFAASLAGAAAPSFALLVVARLGQALAGATLSPSIQALLRSTTPADDRGKTFGLLGSMLGVGAAGGPVIGGGLVQALGWEAIFLVNVPVVAAAFFVPLPDVQPEHAGDEEVSASWVNATFLAGFGVQALTTMGQYMLLLVAPVILDARGWSPGWVGVALSALTVGMIVLGPIGGRVGDDRGRRLPVVTGVTATAGALLVATAAGEGIATGLLIAVLGVSGIGLGFAMPSNMTAALESVEGPRAGTAAGVLSMSRYVGSITTSLIVAAWIADDGGGAAGALAVCSAAAVVALALATRLPGPRPAPSERSQ